MLAWLAVLSQSSVHKSLEIFVLPFVLYFPTAQPHDFRINLKYQRENNFQKVLILSEGVRNQQKIYEDVINSSAASH